jgi:predicted transposase YdaD
MRTIADYYIDQGRAEGRAEGRTEGEISLALKLIETRFGAVPEDLKQRILSITDEEAIERFSLSILNAQELDDLALPPQ